MRGVNEPSLPIDTPHLARDSSPAMSLYVRSKRARLLMNWIPVMLGIVLLILLLLWIWRGLDNLGQ